MSAKQPEKWMDETNLVGHRDTLRPRETVSALRSNKLQYRPGRDSTARAFNLIFIFARYCGLNASQTGPVSRAALTQSLFCLRNKFIIVQFVYKNFRPLKLSTVTTLIRISLRVYQMSDILLKRKSGLITSFIDITAEIL